MASNVEDILRATIDGETYEGNVESRVEELLVELKEAIEEGGGGGFSGSYNDLTNKPTINNISLTGNKTSEDLIPVDSETLDFDENGKLTVIGGGGGGDYETLRQYIYDTYRRERKNITAKVQNGDFDKAVHEQDLAKYGISIGDYFTDSNNYIYYVADMNTFKRNDQQTFQSTSANHVALMVITTTVYYYNSTSSLPQGYNNSWIQKQLKGTIRSNIHEQIENLTGDSAMDHLCIRDMDVPGSSINLTNTMSDAEITLLTESQVVGAPIFSGSKYQQGEGTKKLAIFDKFAFNEFFGTNLVWLRSISSMDSSATTACVLVNGKVSSVNITNAGGLYVGLILYKAKGD